MGASRSPNRLGIVLWVAALGLALAGPIAAASPAIPLSTAAVATPPAGTTGSADADVPALILGTIRLGHHRLIRVPLDGVNEPQLLADVEGPADPEYAPQWSIAPDERTALHLPGRGYAASLIDLDTAVRRDLDPALHLGASDTPPVWSADSSKVAIGGVVLDATSGSAARPDAGDLQVRGFDPAGRLILWTSADDADGLPRLTFFRWDPATPELAPAPIPLSEAVVVEGVPDPVSVPLRSVVEYGQPVGRNAMGLRSLDDGVFTPLAGLPHGRGDAVFDSTGQVMVARIGSHLWAVRPDGSTSPLLDRDANDDAYVDLSAIRFTPDGGLIAVQPGHRADTVIVHEVATGRTVDVPMPRDVALAQLVRVTGSDPLPLVPLARPGAVPAPEETTTGTVVRGSPLVVSERIDRPVGSTAVYSVALGRPASGGVVRTLASHDFPIPPGSDEKSQEARVVAGPGPDTVTVWTGWGSGRHTWTWRLGEEPRRIAMPVAFRRTTDLTWSPDGSTLAAHLRDSDRAIQLWSRRSGRYRLLPIPPSYRGGYGVRWSDDGRSLLIAPGVCSDTCDPPAPNAMLVLPTDGGRPSRTKPDGWYAWDSEGRRLELHRFWDRPGRVRITLPAGTRTMPSGAAAATTDQRSLWVFATHGSDRLLLRYDRPWDRVRAPAQVGLPMEVLSIGGANHGWLTVYGEGTLGCPTRVGLVRPGDGGVRWVGACRDTALVLP